MAYDSDKILGIYTKGHGVIDIVIDNIFGVDKDKECFHWHTMIHSDRGYHGQAGLTGWRKGNGNVRCQKKGVLQIILHVKDSLGD